MASHHDDHSIEPAPSIGTMDIIWFLVAGFLAFFAFTFICFNHAYMDFGKQIWPYIGWVI